MKKNYFISLIGVFAMLIMQSCEKWFEVTPNDQIRAEDQFSSVDGFHDALMGIYIGMGSRQLYGQDMTYNLVDLLSQQYTSLNNLAPYFAVQQFNYQAVRSRDQIEAIWKKGYNVLANVNSALAHLESTDISWNSLDKSLVKGELLALRAYLHFDLLRLFGRFDYANRPELAARPTIPYTSSFSRDPTPQLSYAETFERIEQDIEAALRLLIDDPINPNPGRPADYYAEINRNGFYNNRFKRLNYFAVKALHARVLAYQGGAKLAEAALASEEVIDRSPAQLLPPTANISTNKTIIQEQLFGLDIEGFANVVNPFMVAQNTTDYSGLRLGNALAEALYETSVPGVGAVDIRYNTLLESQTLGMVSIKLRQQSPNDIDYNLMPLIKLPELYYIAASYYATVDASRAIGLLNEVRQSRRISVPLASNLTPEGIQAELIKEFRKEYVGEGQLFFQYKRLGVRHIPNYSEAVDADDAIYMLPYPDSELEFGNRVQ